MRQQHKTFRQEEVQYVYNRWLAGESCALVGAGSIGKSNLMQHLAHPETAKNYLGDSAKHYKVIIIDANMLGALPSWQEQNAEPFRCWAGYELIMHRLYLDFYPLEVLGDDAEVFFDTYQALQDGKNPLYQYMGVRYLELGLTFFMRRQIHLLLMFDEFEELLKQMPSRFFLALRGLRDRYKNQISFLTFSRLPLPQLIENMGLPAEDYEPFIELFSDNICYVGPYSEVDARNMLENLEERHRTTLMPFMRDTLIQVTGGYAGLLRAGFHAVLTMPQSSGDLMTLIGGLLRHEAIQLECLVLWNSLSHIEQKVIMSLAQIKTGEEVNITDKIIQTTIDKLMRKHLLAVDETVQHIHIKPPLFAQYIYQRLG